jgi:hypothetical protein
MPRTAAHRSEHFVAVGFSPVLYRRLVALARANERQLEAQIRFMVVRADERGLGAEDVGIPAHDDVLATAGVYGPGRRP